MIKTRKNSLLLLPSFLCLDSALAISGWAVAVAFDSGVDPAESFPKLFTLFFGVWAIYLADRIYDSYRLNQDGQPTARHHFARRFRPVLWVLVLVTGALAFVQVISIRDPVYWWAGGFLALTTLAYFIVFRLMATRRHFGFPAKELIISLCSSTGVMISAGGIDPNFSNGITALGLASLCFYNCLTISFAESDFDRVHDPHAYFAHREQQHCPSWPVWISGASGCLLFLFDEDLIVGSSLIISSVALFCLARSLDPKSQSSLIQPAADAILLVPWPILILVCFIF